MKKMQYEFKSSFQNSNIEEVSVNFEDEKVCFNIEEVKNTIWISKKLFVRESIDFTMSFDMENENGKIEIPQVNQVIEFTIYDIKFEVNDTVNIGFKYMLESDEVFVSLQLK